MLLYINACVREESRTRRLAEYLIEGLGEPVCEARLCDFSFPPADSRFLKLRDELIKRGEFTNPLFDAARQFAAADTVVVAAPYWDLSFPAALKQYFEQINAAGVTFYYTPEGVPVGLCRAKRLYYVTTAGGRIFSEEYGYGYVRALAEGFYQIPETRLIKAEGLDIQGADTEQIMSLAQRAVDEMLEKEQGSGRQKAAAPAKQARG